MAIRRKNWAELHAADPRNFALDDTATSSEPRRPLVIRSRDHNGMIYANYRILDDYLRDRFKYLSMKDKNRLAPDGGPEEKHAAKVNSQEKGSGRD
jgi:hypothetical protein